MRHKWLRLAATLLALAALASCFSAAFAVVVIPTGNGDDAARLEAAQNAAREQELGSYGMTPVYGRDIADGAYDVAVESTSPFFKIVRATLTVDGDQLTAGIVIGSDSYSRVYMGNMAAAESDEAGWIEGEPCEGGTLFTIPVPALNTPFDCAAFSVNRQRWYDRRLLIDAAALPEGALSFPLPDYALMEKALLAYDAGTPAAGENAPTQPAAGPVALSVPDGEYSVEVNLAGGSGRASVSSPTLLIVRDGHAWARLLWSSAYYDYMLVEGIRYENLTTDGGNSTFEIPVTALDEAMSVIADTTAMGDPIEIEYALTFYAESVADKGRIPQEAAKKVLAISLAIIVLGAVLNYSVKRRRR